MDNATLAAFSDELQQIYMAKGAMVSHGLRIARSGARSARSMKVHAEPIKKKVETHFRSKLTGSRLPVGSFGKAKAPK